MKHSGPQRTEPREHERTEMVFHQYRKVFDLSQFKLTRTDQQLFKDHYHMLNAQQLRRQADTIRMEIDNRMRTSGEMNANYLGSKRMGMLDEASRQTGVDASAYMQSFDPERVFADRVSKITRKRH